MKIPKYHQNTINIHQHHQKMRTAFSAPLRSRHGTQTFMGPCAEIWGHRAWLAENETQHVHYCFRVMCIYVCIYIYIKMNNIYI